MHNPKFIPMPFSTPMVQAIEANQKLQTRRTKGLDYINENPISFRYDGNFNAFGEKPIDRLYHWFERLDAKGNPTERYVNVKCPYGQVGDVLWVRETWQNSLNPNEFVYRSDCDNPIYFSGKWKPSIFMAKKACRYFLKITDIRAERLQSISDNDAIQEGISEVIFNSFLKWKAYRLYNKEISKYTTKPRTSFFSLWTSINGKKSIKNNPWVWVISFERIEKPENFI